MVARRYKDHMWNFARTQTPAKQRPAPIPVVACDLDRIFKRGMFEPLEPPTPKRNRLMFAEELVVEGEDGALVS